MPDNNGVNPAAPVPPVVQVPSVEEMGAQLSQVPQSEAPPALDPQTEQVMQSQVITQEEQAAKNGIALANTPEVDDPVGKAKLKVTDTVSTTMTKSRRWFVKTIGIALTFQGLHGIYKSVLFILVEYPILEQQLVAHQVTQDQINDFGIKAIMMVISTVLSMFFAMKLTFLKTKAAKTISTMIGILLFIGNAMIHDYFVTLNSSQIMVDFIISILHKFQGAPEKIIEQTPFLEEGAEGALDAVWYK